MKKLLLTLFFIFTMSSIIFANSGFVNIVVDNSKSDVQGLVIDGQTLVVVSDIAKDMGYYVTWEPNTKTIILQKYETIKITAQSTTYSVDDKKTIKSDTLTYAPIIYEGRLLMTVRDFCKCINADLKWDAQTKTVHIDTAGNLLPEININIIIIIVVILILLAGLGKFLSLRKCPQCKSKSIYEISRKLIDTEDVYFEHDVIERTYDTRNYSNNFEWQRKGLAHPNRSADALTSKKVLLTGKRKWYLVKFRCTKCNHEFQEKMFVDHKPTVIKSN